MVIPTGNNLLAAPLIADFASTASGGRFSSVDPLSDRYPSSSVYAYCGNNPIRLIDPNGMSATKFEDAEGNMVVQIDDGSNAVFRQTGQGANQHYDFNRYDESQQGTNTVNLTTAIAEQQCLNMENPSLQENADGYGETHCNQATQNVLRVVSSAFNDPSIVINGRANDMAGTLSGGDNKNYLSVDEATANQNALNGGLSVVTYTNPNPRRSGHIAPYSVRTKPATWDYSKCWTCKLYRICTTEYSNW